MKPLWLLSLLIVATGCARNDRPADVAAPAAPPDWRNIATGGDLDRLRRWRDAFTQALEKARRAGYGPQIAAEGPLLAPDAVLPDPGPPPGDYRCRTIKLGAQAPAGPDYLPYPWFNCRIAREKDVLSLVKLDGSQRPSGLLVPAGDTRMIFIGTMALGDEMRAMDYGADPERDMAGAFERIGERRWRLVLPWPRWESTLDVMELVPAGG